MHCVPLPQHLYLEGEVCEKVIQNSTGMKQHLKEHSCKLIQYECSFCSYLAEYDLAIEAHVRITHEGSFDCCICDFPQKIMSPWRFI